MSLWPPPERAQYAGSLAFWLLATYLVVRVAYDWWVEREIRRNTVDRSRIWRVVVDCAFNIRPRAIYRCNEYRAYKTARRWVRTHPFGSATVQSTTRRRPGPSPVPAHACVGSDCWCRYRLADRKDP
jgi:hypothetical protein